MERRIRLEASPVTNARPARSFRGACSRRAAVQFWGARNARATLRWMVVGAVLGFGFTGLPCQLGSPDAALATEPVDGSNLHPLSSRSSSLHRGEVASPVAEVRQYSFDAQRIPSVPLNLVSQVASEDSPAPQVVADAPAGNTGAQIEKNSAEVVQYSIDQAHAACFNGDPFPSANKCGTCHPGHFREWSVSPHGYAQLSPVFNAMSNKLIQLTNGTLGDFCIRCHTPVGMALNEPIAMSQMDRPPSSREGVTCVVCHRINQAFGKGSGRHALVPGDIHEPIYGPIGSDILAQVLSNPEKYGVLKTEAHSSQNGRSIHREAVPFFQLTTSAFCGSCHDVFAPNGFRLEDAFSEFKASPAAREKQQSCQDCHMGVQPGVASGYVCAPAAKVGNALTPPRKRTNHMFVGPDYSIVHPGLFPHNPAAVREEHNTGEIITGLATMREWLLFDYKAGWGTEQFEQHIPPGYNFPEAWADLTRRYRARDILNDQFQLLSEATAARHQILSTGYRLGEIIADHLDERGISFRVLVSNGTDGHGVPTGFDAERVVFLRVTVFDRNGKLVFLSGDLDPNGDLRDSHSFYVHNGELPLDRNLFALQTKFITRNVRGGEREQILNIPYSLDPLPYIRPETFPFTIAGRPQGARKHKQNIEPNGSRWAQYSISRSQLTGQGPYCAHVQLVAGMVPVNLVQAISSVGFDFNMSAREVADAVVDGHMVLHERSAMFPLHQ